MIRRILLLLALCVASATAQTLGTFQAWCESGGQYPITSGITASTPVQASYPSCQITVFLTGTVTPAILYSTVTFTPLANPFCANSDASFLFFAPVTSQYDVVLSNANACNPPPAAQLPSTFTFLDAAVSGSGSGGGGGGIASITTATGSGLVGGSSGPVVNLAMASCSSPNQTQIWNGSSFSCASPSIWSNLSPPVANLSLPLQSGGVAFTSTFSVGDFGVTPVPATTGAFVVTDSSVSSTDNSINLYAGTGNNSFHQPFAVSTTVGGVVLNQLAVCNNGAAHVGFVVIGNAITCPNLSTSPASKLWVTSSSAGANDLTLFQNSTTTVGTLLVLNSATSGTGFNFITACPGATPNADGTCPSGNIVFTLRGDGQLNAANYIGPWGGVSISGTPVIGQAPVATSPTTATWQTVSGGGGGGTGAQWQTAYFGAVNTVNGFGPGKIGQTVVSQGASAAPVYSSAGVPGSTVATASYTVKCDSGTTTLDRLTTIVLTNATPTITIPDPADSGCANNFTFTLLAANGVTATVNRETAATFTLFTGTSSSSAQTTFSLTTGQSARFNSPDNTNYNVVIGSGGGGGSPLWSGLGNPNANLTLSMGAFTSTFNQSTNAAWLWANTTTGTAGTTNASPLHEFAANAFHGGASTPDTWTQGSSLAAGTDGASTLAFAHVAGSTGVAAVSIPNLIVTGSTAHYVPIAQGAGIFTFVTPGSAGGCFLSNGTGADPTFQSCPAGSTTFPLTVSGGVSGGIPYFNSNVQMSASSAGTINTLMKWGGAGAAPTSSSITDAGTTIVASEGLQFSGASGVATTISTSTANANLLLSPNGTGQVVLNNGTATNPSLTFTVNTSYGFYSATSGAIALGTGSASHSSHDFLSSGTSRVISSGVIGFSSSSTDATVVQDIAISRAAANVIAVGNGGAGNTTGTIKAAAYISVGTTFTSNSGCSEISLTGGATAGQFTLGSNSCSIVVTMGNSATAPHGWSCSLNDQTTGVSALSARQTASNSTTATFTFTSAPQISDVITFGCEGY